MNNQSERSNTLDIAKGITIIMMVIGHCYSTNNCILTLIYGFHMPMFFVISGIIFGKKLIGNGNYKFSIPHIAVKLLKPYVGYSALFALFLILLKSAGGEKNPALIGVGYVWKIVSLQGLSVLWYLLCIFMTELIFIYVNKFCKRLLLPISIAIYLFALFFRVDGELIVLWRSFIGFAYFTIGYYIPKLLNKRIVIDFSNRLISVIWVIILFLYVIVSMKNGVVSLVDLKFNNPLLYTVASILGCLSMLLLSAFLSTRTNDRYVHVLIWFGRKTLYILGMHMLFIEVIRLIDYKVLGNILHEFGLAEGIIFGIVVCYILVGIYYANEEIKQNKEKVTCRR